MIEKGCSFYSFLWKCTNKMPYKGPISTAPKLEKSLGHLILTKLQENADKLYQVSTSLTPLHLPKWFWESQVTFNFLLYMVSNLRQPMTSSLRIKYTLPRPLRFRFFGWDWRITKISSRRPLVRRYSALNFSGDFSCPTVATNHFLWNGTLDMPHEHNLVMRGSLANNHKINFVRFVVLTCNFCING